MVAASSLRSGIRSESDHRKVTKSSPSADNVDMGTPKAHKSYGRLVHATDADRDSSRRWRHPFGRRPWDVGASFHVDASFQVGPTRIFAPMPRHLVRVGSRQHRSKIA